MAARLWKGDEGTVRIVLVLTLATGAMDVISFTRLGHVFTSVMTGNIALLGLAVGRRDPVLALSSGLGVIGFIVGVGLGARLGAPAAGAKGVSPRFRLALSAQALALVVFAVSWDLAHSQPTGALQRVLLVLAAAAMGSQSGAVYQLGISGLSSTYMTGTLTGVISDLAHAKRSDLVGRGFSSLLSLALGAAVAGTLVVFLPPLAPWFPVVVVLAMVWTVGSVLLAPESPA